MSDELAFMSDGLSHRKLIVLLLCGTYGAQQSFNCIYDAKLKAQDRIMQSLRFVHADR
jgi:hypothetical protein